MKSVHFSLSSLYSVFPLLCIRKWGNDIPSPVLRLMNFFHYLCHGKSGFFANIYVVHRWKLENNRYIVWRTINLWFPKNLIGEGGNSCYSVPSLGNPLTYVKKVDVMKISQSIMIWYMNLLTLSYPLQYVKRLVT